MNFYENELPGQSKTAVVSQESFRDIRKQAKRGTACTPITPALEAEPWGQGQPGYIASPGLKTDGKPRSEKSASV